MQIRRYTKEDKELWNGFLNEAKNSIFIFNRDYMEYHSDRFEDHSLFFYNEDKLISILPLSSCGKELFSHGGLTFGGFITKNDMKQHYMEDLFACLIDYMRENGFCSLIYKAIPHIYHKQSAEEDIYVLNKINARIMKIEAATVVKLQDRIKMPKGRKAQISRAKREGVIVELSDDFESFINLENEVLKEYHNSKAVHTGEELKLLHEKFPEQIKLYVGKLHGEMISGTVLYINDEVVRTQYLASNDLGREIGALDLVISNVLDKYQDRIWFDFGKSTEGDGSILNEGLIAQKEGFGGRTHVYQTWKVETI